MVPLCRRDLIRAHDEKQIFGGENAIARHDLLIKGEITKAMQMLRCIERVESYLFPKRIAKRVLPPQLKIPQKQWRMWIRMLHVGKIKPQRRKRAL